MKSNFALLLVVGALLATCACSENGIANGNAGSGGAIATGGSGAGAGQGGGGGDAGTGGGGAGTGGENGGAGGVGTDVYGVLNTISFSTAFLYDGNKLEEPGYVQEHMAQGIQWSPAFRGTYTSGNKPIPPDGMKAVALGFHLPAEGQDPASISVKQELNTAEWVGHDIFLAFDGDVLSVGTAKVGVEAGDDAGILVFDLRGFSSYCLAAVGIGSIDITHASNTTGEGGSLEFSGSDVALYHPTDTPSGDISHDFLGVPICAKE